MRSLQQHLGVNEPCHFAIHRTAADGTQVVDCVPMQKIEEPEFIWEEIKSKSAWTFFTLGEVHGKHWNEKWQQMVVQLNHTIQLQTRSFAPNIIVVPSFDAARNVVPLISAQIIVDETLPFNEVWMALWKDAGSSSDRVVLGGIAFDELGVYVNRANVYRGEPIEYYKYFARGILEQIKG